MNKKILIVEDDELIRMLLHEVLCDNGYDTHEAADGEEGLRLYKENLFPVVITDLEMPVMNGYDFINSIKHIDLEEETNIIILTMHDQSDTKSKL